MLNLTETIVDRNCTSYPFAASREEIIKSLTNWRKWNYDIFSGYDMRFAFVETRRMFTVQGGEQCDDNPELYYGLFAKWDLRGYKVSGIWYDRSEIDLLISDYNKNHFPLRYIVIGQNLNYYLFARLTRAEAFYFTGGKKYE